MHAIEACRTPALGGHVARCRDCAHIRVAYNSCRNRHCPKCQGAAARDWLAARQAELLPVPYFHVVFTVPARIADIAYQNKAVVYDILFKASAETLLGKGDMLFLAPGTSRLSRVHGAFVTEDEVAELTGFLREQGAPGRRFDVVFRAFDDGVAFRYLVPEQEGLGDVLVTDELTEFALTGDHACRGVDESTADADGLDPVLQCLFDLLK